MLGGRVKEYRKAVEELDRGEIRGSDGNSDPNKSHKELHPVKF